MHGGLKPRTLLAFIGVFALGVALGHWLSRGDGRAMHNDSPSSGLALDAGSPATGVTAVNPSSSAASAPAMPAPHSTPLAVVPAPAAPEVPPPVATAMPGYERPVDSGVVRAIDVGEVLRKQIDRPSEPGNENHIGDAHRALEREPRDEGWAYTMEAELQNSMLSETSLGSFRAENIECRSTLCEVWITGSGDQSAAVRRWSESLANNPMISRLQLNMSSTISNNDRIDGLYIFRRPARK